MRIPKLTYSNVAATLALFLALGGGAYAISLGKGSVKRKNIANGAVSTKKLAKNAVTGAKARESSFGTVPSATNAAKLGGVGPGGYVVGVNANERVKSEQVPVGGDGVEFSVTGIGTIQFRDCATPGASTPVGNVVYTSTSSAFEDVIDTILVSGATPTVDYVGLAGGSILSPVFNIPDNKSRARIDIQVGRQGATKAVLYATLAVGFSGTCNYSLWTSKVEEEQG
jgi:hypothetical protein